MENKQSVSEKVQETLFPIVENLGYELVETAYKKTQDGMVLTLYIHNENGITLDDCEVVSRGVDEALEELDPTHGETYFLNVSSLGLDRPIKNHKDAQRNIGFDISVKLYATEHGNKEHEGKLVACTEKGLIIRKDNGEEVSFEFKKIANAVRIIKI